MNWFAGLDLPKIVTTVSVLFALATLLVREVTRARHRTNQLRMAAAALTSHYDAMERLITDPATPAFILETIDRTGDAFLDRDRARSFTAFLCSDEVKRGMRLTERDRQALASLEDLRRHRKDLFEDFITWVMSGTFAGILRWPETSEMVEEMMARVASSTREEEKFASRVLAWKGSAPAAPNLVAVAAG